MAMAVAISPGILILLLHFQNTLAEQCLNNVGYNNLPGLPQQSLNKPSCGLDQITQNGLNLNSPQQRNVQQVNFQQHPNIQQAPFTQPASNQQNMYSQQSNSKQPANSISYSQLLKQPNQDVAGNIFSTLYNIKQSSQNQRDARNIFKGQQMNYETQTLSQNQLNPILTESGPMNKAQNNQPYMSNAYSENSQFQPGFTFQFVPNNNIPMQPNQQMFAQPVHKVSANDQNHVQSIQSQPLPNSMSSQQATIMQSPIVMIPGTQTNTGQNQPIILTLQSPQVSTIQNQPTQPTTQTNNMQPILYTLQTQPSSQLHQNQQILRNPTKKQVMNNLPTDKQSLMSYVMTQIQNNQGSGNKLASILPAVLNTKSEKSSSMNTLLPLIFSILNEKKSCCGCPHCDCNNSNNNDQNKPEPIVNTGYSTQMNYSPQKSAGTLEKYTDKSVDSTGNDAKEEQSKVANASNNNTSISEEEDEATESEEEYDEE